MTPRSSRPALFAAALVLAAGLALPAQAQSVSRLRVMLHPYAADAGTLPDAAKAKLEALAGISLTLAGTTRTGALEFTFPMLLDEDAVAAIARRMRDDRAIVWVQPVLPTGIQKSAKAAPDANLLGRRFLVKLADGVSADWTTLLPQFAARLGIPLAVERNIAGVWLLTLQQAQPQWKLAELAEALQQDPAIRYADPVRRLRAKLTPNDPLLSQQWSLIDPLSGVNATAAWGIQTGVPNMTVAVIDTGILPHPDLDGRVLPGYDFISDAESARDGDARDPNPRDEGTFGSAADCGVEQDSFWHGLFVAGQIAANSNNGVGIAGMNWAAKILPVRTLGRCGFGTDVDVFEGMLWAAGVQIAGVPPNPNPARVLNMSLGGYGTCGSAIQEAVDLAMAQGAVVVVSAGNESDNVSNYAPSNCAGVITVGASGVSGDRSSYSNFGRRVDITAPGGDIGNGAAGYVLSTASDGTTVPGGPAYVNGIGTSFAAPLVSGTVSLMLARNANLTPGRVMSIITGTARDFPAGTQCGATNGKLCGVGLLDAGVALASTIPATGILPIGAVPVVEYYRADLDHYFYTAWADEMYYIDTFLADVYQRTGGVFYAYLSPELGPPAARPVCRFFASGLINSHFYTASPVECQFILSHWRGVWNLETPAAFWIEIPDNDGNCLDGRIPVYRFFNNRNDANHRLTIDLSERRAMINRAWVPEGTGPRAAVFCSPI